MSKARMKDEKLTPYQERELERAARNGLISWRSTTTLEKRGLVRAIDNPGVVEILLNHHRKVAVTAKGRRVLREIEYRFTKSRLWEPW